MGRYRGCRKQPSGLRKEELREALGSHYIETVPGRGYRFTTPVRSVEQRMMDVGSPVRSHWTKIVLQWGRASANTSFYVRREADDQLYFAVARSDTLVLLKGPRQVGKLPYCWRGGYRNTGARWDELLCSLDFSAEL